MRSAVRLAKRHDALSLRSLRAKGMTPQQFAPILVKGSDIMAAVCRPPLRGHGSPHYLEVAGAAGATGVASRSRGRSCGLRGGGRSRSSARDRGLRGSFRDRRWRRLGDAAFLFLDQCGALCRCAGAVGQFRAADRAFALDFHLFDRANVPENTFHPLAIA